MTTQVAHTAIKLNEPTRELLKMMNFHAIPEDANYVAFFDDGEACFLDSIEPDSPLGVMLPRIMFLSIQFVKDVTVEFTK